MKIAAARTYFLLFLTTVMLAAPAGAFPVMRSVPPESFLDYHVDSVPQLTFEVAYDPAVRARLAHHFHLSGPAMCAYVRDNLVLQDLRAPLKTRVYCVRPDGREFFVLMTLQTGTPIFALRRTGKPILRLVCGNPLVAELPPLPKKAVAKAPRLIKTRVAGAKLLQTTPQIASGIVTAPLAAPVVTTGFIQTVGAGDVFVTAASGAGASWLGWVPLAGGTLAFLSSGGGGHGGTPTGTDTLIPTGGHQSSGVISFVPSQAVPDAPQPVPEPNPALALLLGGLGLVLLRLSRRWNGAARE